MMLIRFTIPGDPIGKPRMTQRDKWMKRKCVQAYWDWKAKVKAKVKDIAGTLPPADQIISLSWVAYFSPPASWSKKKRTAHIGQLHRTRPDRDNVDKALLDAMFDDDSGIASGTIEKRWDVAERLEVVIETLSQESS